MKKIIIGAAVAAVGLLSAATISPRTVIVKDKLTLLPEKNAARILSEVLGEMFGKKMKVIDIKDYNGRDPAIILRPQVKITDPEEWKITSSGNITTIEGGKTVGVLFGTYELLENAGCRYFAPHCRYIPKKSFFKIPDRIAYKKPLFERRTLHSLYFSEYYNFVSWHRMNYHLAAIDANNLKDEEKHQYLTQRQLGGNCHTFHFWSKQFPKDSLECFSMDQGGRRLRSTSAMGPGQFCLSNPRTRTLLKKIIVQEIKKDREMAKKYNYPPAKVINLTHNDNGTYCVCDGCRALLKKYGQYSGVMIDFVNDVASCAPDMIFETFAYTFTELPPKGIKPAENVMIYVAYLGPELMNGKCDTMRSLNHPNNQTVLGLYKQWGNISNAIVAWLYLRLYRQGFPAPYSMIKNIGENFRILHQNRVRGLFCEAEFNDLEGRIGNRSFHDLHNYLTVKLMRDPYQDENVLISEFMTHYYGAAAKEMTAFLNYLEKRMDEEKRMLGRVPEGNRSYMDSDFLSTINKHLVAALAKVEKDSLEYRRIQTEFLLLDMASAFMWEKLPDLGKKLGMTRKQLFDRLEKYGVQALKHVFADKSFTENGVQQKILTDLHKKIAALRHPFPVPEIFKKRRFIRHLAGLLNMVTVVDPAATGGRAIALNPKVKDFSKPIEGGIWTGYNQRHYLRWKPDQKIFKRDEKYHLYYFGSCKLPGPETQPQMWIHSSWTVQMTQSLRNAYNPIDSDRVYDIYVSLKLTGPAYVKGSTKPNGIFVDQIFYVEQALTSSLPNSLKDRTGTAFNVTPDCAVKMPVVEDPASATGTAVRLAPDRSGRLEFGFYSRAQKKILFRKYISRKFLKNDGRYHLYFLGKQKLPEQKQKTVFWGHESWNLQLNPILDRAREAFGTQTSLDIFVSLKYDNKDAFIDRVLFLRAAE